MRPNNENIVKIISQYDDLCRLCMVFEREKFFMLYDFDGGKSITRAISTYLGPNGTRFARGHFRDHKNLDFQGPLPPMALEMDFPPSKSLRPAPYKQQVH
jgi:hypothetical protein